MTKMTSKRPPVRRNLQSGLQQTAPCARQQAARDHVRLGWARHVLDEESAQPRSHSAARLRRAHNVLSKINDGKS